ncbi:MAG: MmgE/PrpD family protein [Desulfobacterales bacterium]|nr:MmgE/PrpD family protein [Desulfobacterales bacterium]
MSETQVLADFIARTNYEDLPAHVVENAKERIGDILACGFAGRKTLEGDILIDMMKEIGGKQEATVIGDKTRLSFMQAAQVNRVLTNMADYDDDFTSICHMTTVLVPVALALGERINASGKDIINAYVLGCETVIRIRDAVSPSVEAFYTTFERVDAGLHLGVTATAGRLLGLNGEQMADAIGLTGQMRPTRVTRPDWAKKGMPRWMKITNGDITIPGIHSVFLAQRGFSGDRWMLDQGRNFQACVGSDRYDASELTENLGTDYGILRIGYKFFSACRYTSSTLDAVSALVSENQVTAENVEQVIVKVQKLVSENFAIYEPGYRIQAQFSMPYVVTMALMGEPTGPNWYREELLHDPKVLELQHRVKLEEDPLATKSFYPGYKTPSTVEIIMKDGARYSKSVKYPRGEPENPFTKQDHIDKLTNMALWVGMRQEQIDELIRTLDGLDRLENISELTRLLAL